MAIVFPASPSNNDTFTVGSITYTYDGSKWIGLGVTPTDRLIEGSNSLEINASNELVWTGGDAKIGGSLEVSANIDLTDSTVDLYSQTTNAASKTFQLFSDIGGTKTEKLSITANGAVTLTDQIKIEGGSTPTGLSSRISKYGSLLIGTSSDAVGAARCSIDSGNGNITSVGTITTGSTFSVANVSGSIAGSGGGQDYIGLRHGTTFGLMLKTAGTNVGNVGIGETDPSYELHVKGSGTVAYFEGTGGNSFIGLEDSDDSTIGFIGVDGGSLKFQTSGNSYSDKLVITSDGYVTKPKQPGFIARYSVSETTWNVASDGWTKIPFDEENMDRGSNFNTSTSEFTAPVAGTYLFGAELQLEAPNGISSGYLTSGSNWMYITFIVNGSTTLVESEGGTRTDANFNSMYNSYNPTHLLQLAAGDTVCMYRNGNYSTIKFKGGGESVFWGYLVG
jgi:hypothetical protein